MRNETGNSSNGGQDADDWDEITVDAIEVEIEDEDEFEKLTNMGTLYNRTERRVVATIVGDTENRVNFVYEK